MRSFILLAFLIGTSLASKITEDSVEVINPKDPEGDIIYPTNETVWVTGQYVNVTFRPTTPPTETVSIFFNSDRTVSLGGGPGDQLVFPFVVPPLAISPPGQRSLLIAVRRQKDHIVQTIDAVNVKVISPDQVPKESN